ASRTEPRLQARAVHIDRGGYPGADGFGFDAAIEPARGRAVQFEFKRSAPRPAAGEFARLRRSTAGTDAGTIKTARGGCCRGRPDQSSDGVTTSIQVFYEGNVQGVGFRYTIRQIAKGFDITGSVRNLRDGR